MVRDNSYFLSIILANDFMNSRSHYLQFFQNKTGKAIRILMGMSIQITYLFQGIITQIHQILLIIRGGRWIMSTTNVNLVQENAFFLF